MNISPGITVTNILSSLPLSSTVPAEWALHFLTHFFFKFPFCPAPLSSIYGIEKDPCEVVCTNQVLINWEWPKGRVSRLLSLQTHGQWKESCVHRLCILCMHSVWHFKPKLLLLFPSDSKSFFSEFALIVLIGLLLNLVSKVTAWPKYWPNNYVCLFFLSTHSCGVSALLL